VNDASGRDAAPAIAPPEPNLTPAAMIARATALRAVLRAAQGDCERQGRVSDAINETLIRAGFYRVIQPRLFGGYEFDVPTFYRVMMEVARGCPETGWVLALTAGHPLIVASFPLEGQAEVYGANGEFRCPAAFNPHGLAVPVAGGYHVTASWASASGCDIGTHHIGSAAIADGDGKPTTQIIQLLLTRDQYRIIDDWHVMGMQGTGSKRIVVEGAFVPARRTVAAVGVGRGNEAAKRTGLHANPLYLGRTASFLIGEAASVAVGAARGALDLYEDVLREKRAYHPPYHERHKEPEFQSHYGRALGLIATAEAALIRAGEDYMDFARTEAAGGAPFDDEKDLRLLLIEQQAIRLAWDGIELIYRTVGTSDAARDGATIGRIFRNMAVINTHPALQPDRTAINAARARFGLLPLVVAPERTR
jgi:3-hydroxy-9,10-secoandrosta-1,3,5(10)-triene-9,17-dione monooxygenase